MPAIVRRFAGILALNCTIVLTLVVIVWVLSDAPLSAILHSNLTIAFLYANCIGTLAALCLPALAPYVSGWPAPWNWLVILAALLVLNAMGCALAGAVIYGLGLFPKHQFWFYFARGTRLATLITVAFGMSCFVYETYRHRLTAATEALKVRELERERAVKLATEARLASLESRIHPHFLFNTINSVLALIREDPVKAERMLERLAAVLRFSLDSIDHGLVPLGQELKIVADYLEIEHARFGDRLRYTIEVPAEALECDLPPMAIQTLVENSVKHAIATRREGGEIRISSSVEAGQVTIVVRDPGSSLSVPEIKPGRGLENLQSRLAVLFGDAAALALNGSEVRVRVPVRSAMGRA